MALVMGTVKTQQGGIIVKRKVRGHGGKGVRKK